MDATVESRFERIERILAQTAELALGNQRAIIQFAESTKTFDEKITGSLLALGDALLALTGRVERFIAASEARQLELNSIVGQFVAGAEARAKMIETSLDNLIRIIAAEHSNGKRRE
jgi:hypothetical protein